MTYICPMCPGVVSDKPGRCPNCGMALVYTKTDIEHKEEKHKGHSVNIFKTKFWVSLALTVPVVWIAFRGGPQYVSLVLASLVFFYGGWVFLRSAWNEVRGRLPGMMTLISLAILAAYGWSVYAVIAHAENLFGELTTLITIMLLGHWIEMRSVQATAGALGELSKLLPDTAEMISGAEMRTVQVGELKVGDLVLIRPGARVPADGVVVSGTSEVDESLMTGESKPVKKEIGAEVIAGSTNGDGSLTVRITKIGEGTFLAGVMRLVAEAQSSKSRLQMLSDKAALALTIIAVVVGGITFGTWIALGFGVAFAVERLVAVLVITCPHALGLAVPLVASISTSLAAKRGFLVRERMALEAARNIDVVVFDKTGTLTEGAISIVSYTSDESLALAASVETHSEHPIARGIVAEAKKRGLVLREATNFKRIPGVGAEAEVGGAKIFVGHRGGADIQVEINGKNVGSITLADKIRPEARGAVRQLKEMGLRVAMITGDSEEVAESVAKELGLDEYFARVLPEGKAERVKALQAQGLRVAMVGDGVNDAPALTQANVGIAISAGTNVAIESAGIILVRNDPRDIASVIELSRATYRKMVQNLFWATGYNVIAIPLAAGVLISRGITLAPAASAVLMSLSTVIVAVNALSLRRAL